MSKAKSSKEQVLIILNSDGYIEVYGDKSSVTVAFATMPHTHPANEIAAEEYLESFLIPKNFRHLFERCNRLGAEMLRKVTVDDLVRQELMKKTFQGLTECGNYLRGGDL